MLPNNDAQAREKPIDRLKNNEPVPSADMNPRDLALLAKNTTIGEKVDTLHRLILDECPDSLVQLRKDEALIYVHPRCVNKARKNLMTVPLGDGRVRIIFPPNHPGEEFDAKHLSDYQERLRQLNSELGD